MMNRIMKDENGVLTFEWILLITLLVIGIVGGVAAIRDALIIEAAETAGAIVALDQSYTISGPWKITLTTAGTETKADLTATYSELSGFPSSYSDTKGTVNVSYTGSTVPGAHTAP